MSHRIVSAVVGLVLLLFVGSASLFGLGMTPPRVSRAAARVPPLPHGATGSFASCRDCHAPGAAVPPLPATHRTFLDEGCVTCHRPQRAP